MYVLEQKRLVPGGSILTPNKVYVTTHRIIFLDPRWLGLKAEIIDVACEDISNIQLRRGVFSTAIRIHSRFLGEEIKPPAVSKSRLKQHLPLYRRCIHEIKSGIALPQVKLSQPKEDLAMKLAKLKEMYETGLLSSFP
ncbi:MAG TPA: hypothetical protein EYP68_05245 [Candidatus Korarchaeota archaeon]|nr:hypothetical protein [Candidatus Korarchaeota archaeon]